MSLRPSSAELVSVPAIDRHLAGDDRRPALVAVLDDLEEVAPLIVGERFGSPIVEDEQVDPFERLQQPRISTVTAGEAKVSFGVQFCPPRRGYRRPKLTPIRCI